MTTALLCETVTGRTMAELLAAREGAGLGIDPTRLAVGGDSAGANQIGRAHV